MLISQKLCPLNIDPILAITSELSYLMRCAIPPQRLIAQRIMSMAELTHITIDLIKKSNSGALMSNNNVNGYKELLTSWWLFVYPKLEYQFSVRAQDVSVG